MKITHLALVFTIAILSPRAFSKEPPPFLLEQYTTSDVVAKVAVTDAQTTSPTEVEFTIHLLRVLKGTTDKKVLAHVATRVLPVEAPHLSVGDVGLAFFTVQEKTGSLRLARFIPATDLLVDTKSYRCKSLDDPCSFERLSQVEAYFEKH